MKQPLLIYANYLPTAAVTATDTAAGLDPNDVLQAEEDNVWQPLNATGPKNLVIDLGASQELGCLGLVGESLNGVILEVRASSDNFVTSDVQMSAPATIDDFISTWRAWGNATYRYWKLVFSNLGASFLVAHLALCHFDFLPWFSDGMDPDAYQTTGYQLTSPGGHYLGSNRLRTMRSIDLMWGKVTDAHYALFQAWAEVCVHQMNAFFLVPDSSQATCYFCWLSDPKFTWKVPRQGGVRTMPTIAVTSRVP